MIHSLMRHSALAFGLSALSVACGGSFGDAKKQWQQRLAALEGLYLRFLVQAEDHRVIGQVKIESDDVSHLFRRKSRRCSG